MRRVLREKFTTVLIDGQVEYPINNKWKNIVSVRVNNFDLSVIHVIKRRIGEGRYIDISQYTKKYPEIKEGTITVFVDFEKGGVSNE